MAELAPLSHVHAFPLGRELPLHRIAGHVALKKQARVFALSKAGPATIAVHQADIEDDWLEPATAWLIVSELGLPPWLGYVDLVREKGDAISITLKDPLAAVLADTRSTRDLVFSGSTGAAVHQLLTEAEAYQGTAIAEGSIAPGPAIERTLKANTLLAGLKQIRKSAPGYDYWLQVVGDVAPEVYIHWGLAGAEHSNITLTEGQEIVGEPALIRRRAGLVRSVLVADSGYTFRHGKGAEKTSGEKDAGVGDYPVTPVGPGWIRPPSPSPGGRKQDVLIEPDPISAGQLAQRAEAAVVRRLELALELELTLDLSRDVVRDLWLGDVVRVHCPTLRCGGGFAGTVRILGLEPHEETAQIDAIVTVLEENTR